MYENLLSVVAFMLPITLFIVVMMIKDRWFYNPINDIETFIEMMRGDPDEIGKLNTYVFTQGECWRFAAVALITFPRAKAHLVWDKINKYSHVVVELGPYYFDINGVYYNTRSVLLNYHNSKDQFEIMKTNLSLEYLKTEFDGVEVQRIIDYNIINYEVINIHSPKCEVVEPVKHMTTSMQDVKEFMFKWNKPELLKKIGLHVAYISVDPHPTVVNMLEAHLQKYTMDWILALLFYRLRICSIYLAVDKDTCEYEIFIKYGNIYFSRHTYYDTDDIFHKPKIVERYDLYQIDPNYLVINNNFRDCPFKLNINLEQAWTENIKYENPEIVKPSEESVDMPAHWLEDADKEGIDITNPTIMKIIEQYTTYWHSKIMLHRFLKIHKYLHSSSDGKITIETLSGILDISERAATRTLDKLTDFGILTRYRTHVHKDLTLIYYTANYCGEKLGY